MTFDSASIPGCEINFTFKHNDKNVVIGTVQRVRYEKRSQEEPSVSYGRSGIQNAKGVTQIKGSLTLLELQESTVIALLKGLKFLKQVGNGFELYENGNADVAGSVGVPIQNTEISFGLLNKLLKGIDLVLTHLTPNSENFELTDVYQKDILGIFIDGESSAIGLDALALQAEIPFTASKIKPFRKEV